MLLDDDSGEPFEDDIAFVGKTRTAMPPPRMRLRTAMLIDDDACEPPQDEIIAAGAMLPPRPRMRTAMLIDDEGGFKLCNAPVSPGRVSKSKRLRSWAARVFKLA